MLVGWLIYATHHRQFYDELVEIISKARMAGPKLIPVLGTVN